MPMNQTTIAQLNDAQRDAALRCGLANYESAFRARDPDGFNESLEQSCAFHLCPSELGKDQQEIWTNLFGNLNNLRLVYDFDMTRNGNDRTYTITTIDGPRFKKTYPWDALSLKDASDDIEFIRIETGKGGRQLFAVSKADAKA
tara:strand:- start:72 stop:503 length:432 start_codon:yes stop_codon:yes gene_type:complete